MEFRPILISAVELLAGYLRGKKGISLERII
jgi:hypothetical protein